MISKTTSRFLNLCQFYQKKSLIRRFSSSQIPKIFKSRQQHIQQIKQNNNYDVTIIGGGCNGIGTYVQSCFRGFRTLLIEKDDFGSGASSKSTKLFHGGVRYLQQAFQLSTASLTDRKQKFRLVTQAIMERSLALQNYGYLSSKLKFVLPAKNWFWGMYYYTGLLIYYLIFLLKSPSAGPKFLPPKIIGHNQIKKIFPYISDNYKCGVIYEDGVFNDSRLLILSLLTGTQLDYSKKSNPQHEFQQAKSGNFINKAQLTNFIKNQKGLICGIQFLDKIHKQQINVNAKYVIDCTGSWTDQTRKLDFEKAIKCNLSVAGSHITYSNKYFNNQYGLCVPSKDGRVILVVPWLGHVIAGTTQVTFDAPTNEPKMNQAERAFIRNAVQQTFGRLDNSMIRQTQQSAFCGLRPLVLNVESKDTKSISRDFVIRKSSSGLFSLNGGKWTIFRKMGEQMIQKIIQQEKTGKNISKSSATANLKLIGCCENSVQKQLIQKFDKIGKHLFQFYGSFALDIVKGDMTVIHDVYTRAQIQWIIKNQMPNDLQDIILRRTRIGFVYKEQQIREATKQIAKIYGQINNLSSEDVDKMYLETIQKIKNSGYGF